MSSSVICVTERLIAPLSSRTLAPTLLPPSTARPIAARRWQRRSSGPVVRRMRSAEGRASRRAPDLHPTTVSRRSDNVDGLRRARSSRRSSAHDANKWPHSATRHRRWVEVARADQRAFVRSDAVDPRDRCACHLRYSNTLLYPAARRSVRALIKYRHRHGASRSGECPPSLATALAFEGWALVA